jgi:transposase-like protein
MANTNRSSQTQQMFRVVERYYRSGLSRRQICEQEEISLSKLNYWINRYRREKHFF